MRDPPPEVVATWPKPNYVDPEYQGHHMAIIGITFLIISFIIVALRMYVRLCMRRSAGWDDWLIVITMPFVVGITASTIISTQYGWGLHIWDVKPEWSKATRLSSWFSQLLFVVVMCLVKLSLLASYLRFLTTRRYVTWTWIMIAVVAAWGITFSLTMFLTCIPLSRYWDAATDVGCMSESGRVLGATITNIITDLVILALPIPTLWKLHLPIRERIILITLMSLGLIACAASVVRAYYMYSTVDLTYDVTWIGYNIWVWNAIEVNLAVICASVPILRPFAQRYLSLLGFRQTTNRYMSGTRLGDMNSGIYKQHTIQQVVTSRRDYDADSGSSSAELREDLEYPLPAAKPYNSRHDEPWTRPGTEPEKDDPLSANAKNVTSLPARDRRSLRSSFFNTFQAHHEFFSSLQAVANMALTRSNDPLVWIDCEMTGLNPDSDQILQICCFITDAQLNLIDPAGFEAVIHHPQHILNRLMNPWCVDTHGRSGLTAAVLASSIKPHQAAADLLAYIKKHVPEPRKALLAGNSVHADKAFLAHEPYAKVLSWLHYRILDVSSLKEAVRRWGDEELMKEAPPKKGKHLARDDILESIEEMKFYRDRVIRT